MERFERQYRAKQISDSLKSIKEELLKAINEEVKLTTKNPHYTIPHVDLISPVTYEMIGDSYLEVCKVYTDGSFLNNDNKICKLDQVNITDLYDILQVLLFNNEETLEFHD